MMKMSILKEIENLNKQIEILMVEKTKYDAQKDVWESRLVESIDAYKKEFGVDISGSNLADIKRKLGSEIKVVEENTMKEFERSTKLVNLINSGDIKGAWKELGVDIDSVNTEKEEVVNEEVVVTKEVTPSEEVSVVNTPEQTTVVDVEDEVSDDDFYGSSFEDDEEEVEPSFLTKPVIPSVFMQPTEEEKVVAKPYNAFVVEDDDEDEFIIPSTKGSSSVPVLEEDDEDEFIIPSTKTSVVEDDSDDEFGGFGNILEGSKFQVD